MPPTVEPTTPRAASPAPGSPGSVAQDEDVLVEEAEAGEVTEASGVAAVMVGDTRGAARRGGAKRKSKKSLFEKVEAFVSRLSTRNNFWHRVCSMFWLPYAFRSGIKMKRLDPNTYTAVLPFSRFNKNWYNAMAGAALLGNSEIAGGMYVFGVVGGDYTVVCKRLEYKFLRPCFGPAIYKITPQEDLHALVESGGEFNVTVDLRVIQSITKPGGKEKLVGRSTATFHVTPKEHHKRRKARRKAADPSA